MTVETLIAGDGKKYPQARQLVTVEYTGHVEGLVDYLTR